MGWIWTVLPKERELDLLMFGEEGREMPRTSLRFPFGRLSGRGTTAGEFEDQGVRWGADSRHSHTNLIRVPEGAMSGSKERSCDKGLWGH